MGVPKAFDRVIETIQELKKLQKTSSFFFGINQTITDWSSYEDSKEIRKLCRKEQLAYLPVLAYKPVALYDQSSQKCDDQREFVPFGEFSKGQLQEMLADFLAETANVKDLIERVVKRYYLKGLSSRLLKGRKKPHPRCVALRNHIRLLPNGDVSVCLYNSKIVGNLVHQNLEDVWDSRDIHNMRKWVDACPGCWVECEAIPSAVFSPESLVSFLTSI